MQLPTYPSPNLTLALTRHQLTPAGLGEGWVSSCSGIDFHANVAVISMMIVSQNEYSFLPQFTHLHKFIELSGCLPNVMFGFCYVFIKNLLSTSTFCTFVRIIILVSFLCLSSTGKKK